MGFMELLARLTHPGNQAILLALLGIALWRWRGARTGGVVLMVAILWLWLWSAPAVAAWLQRGLEHGYQQKPAVAYPVADAIVVLGGGDLPPPAGDWSDGDGGAEITRLGFGLQLYQAQRAGTLLLSGGDQSLKMEHRLERQGVPIAAMRTEDTSENTHQNALYSAAILKRENLRRILLVTSGIHMPRARASFAREGLTVIPAPAPDPGTLRSSYRWWPQRAALTMSARCLREHLGLWVYRLRGWV
jgi:uncharacterized SAM-binding protein YcdF (DUF218 family)